MQYIEFNRPYDSPFVAAPSLTEFDKSKGDFFFVPVGASRIAGIFIFRGQGISPHEMLRSVPAESTAQSLTQAVESQSAGYNTSQNQQCNKGAFFYRTCSLPSTWIPARD